MKPSLVARRGFGDCQNFDPKAQNRKVARVFKVFYFLTRSQLYDFTCPISIFGNLRGDEFPGAAEFVRLAFGCSTICHRAVPEQFAWEPQLSALNKPLSTLCLCFLSCVPSLRARRFFVRKQDLL